MNHTPLSSLTQTHYDPLFFFLTRIILTGRKAPQILGWEILLIWLETFCTAGIRLIIILVIHHSIIIKKNQFLRQRRRYEKLSVPSRYTSKSQSAMDSKIDIYLEYRQFYQQQRNVLYLTIGTTWELRVKSFLPQPKMKPQHHFAEDILFKFLIG